MVDVKAQDSGEILKSGDRGWHQRGTLQANPAPPILQLGTLRSEEGIQCAEGLWLGYFC